MERCRGRTLVGRSRPSLYRDIPAGTLRHPFLDGDENGEDVFSRLTEHLTDACRGLIVPHRAALNGGRFTAPAGVRRICPWSRRQSG
jgi:hypothetical protein